MPQQPVSGFLVTRLPAGFGDSTPLVDGTKLTIGRAADNRLVVRDDLCSRYHAEVYYDNGWVLKDLGSLNGCELNGRRVKGEVRLFPNDELRIGGTVLVYVPTLDQLPGGADHDTRPPDPGRRMAITKRLNKTRYLSPADPTAATLPAAPAAGRPNPSEALGVLYRLAVEMAEARSPAALADLTARALVRATPAEVAAVLAAAGGRDLEPLASACRTPGRATFHKVSRFVTQEVLSTRQAVLAEDVAADKDLNTRDSLTELRAASLICAPVLADGRPLGVVHLFTTNPELRLGADDLELAVAAAHQLGVVWAGAKAHSGLTAEVRALKDQLRIETELVGDSPAVQALERQIGRVAATRATVLVRGESGVGKELVARAVHLNSPRKDGPFVCLNCAALTETLLESELFGHEKGAFTGATERMAGKFEQADGGTIFLDEIGEMSLTTQAKFLRVLEGQPFERVGGHTPIKADVRVIAATNRPLEDAVRAGQFRKDLYFRLQVVQIDVPPLRDRSADVPALADHFLRRFARDIGRKVTGLTPAAVAKLQAHPWPGNVRELRNVIERAVALGAGPEVDAADVWLSPLGSPADGPDPAAYRPRSLDDVEREHIQRTLDHTNWNKSQAAAILGIERSTLDRKIKGYGLAK